MSNTNQSKDFCRFPDCKCPMDPGPSPDWCAIGLPHARASANQSKEEGSFSGGDLHARIMNLPCAPKGILTIADAAFYRRGHRDARHAAAELVAADESTRAPELERYDAGLLSDYGGGNAEWWQDYIRSELDRAHDFYQSQVPERAAGLAPTAAAYRKAQNPPWAATADWDKGWDACRWWMANNPPSFPSAAPSVAIPAEWLKPGAVVPVTQENFATALSALRALSSQSEAR